MADKSDSGGQPTIEKLTSEGVSIRKCIASGEDYGNGGNSSKSSNGSKPKGVLASVKMSKGY
jgi:hypothetical protein